MLQSPEFWVAVGFVILIVAIARPVGRAVGAMLDARSERIRTTLDEAKQLREEAQHVLAEYQRKQRDSVKETEEMLAKEREEGERLKAEAVEDLETALKRRGELAHEKIAQAEAEAVKEVREVAVEVAMAATRKIIADRMDEADAKSLVDDAIEDLSKRLH